MSARKIFVQGLVQGVGFRPFVYRLAIEESLAGTVLNDGQGVVITLEGSGASIGRFLKRLVSELPRLASIESLQSEEIPETGLSGFRIVQSEHNRVTTGVTPDAAVCPECLKELFDRSNRRYRYPFINCTHCGPRFTITAHLPYDRPQTSMAKFVMCPLCQAEYDDPLNRRFHAQPNACPACGPSLKLTDRNRVEIPCPDIFAKALELIKNGAILAVKGLGGFHLVCSATDPKAVEKLRERKHREAKPFAIMLANARSASRFVRVTPAIAKSLESVEAPIVLCGKLQNTDELLPGIAPGLTSVGVMLPYTPVHWLFFYEAAGRPDNGLDWLKDEVGLALVMTSANPAGEPLVIDNEEAYERLGGIADAFLIHNRDILLRCDDSVVQVRDEKTRFIRRSRGYTPRAVILGQSVPEILGTGAYYKNTACLTKGRHAYLTPHIGELDRPSNCRALKESIRHLMDVLEIRPKHIVCDLHPDFYSSRLAEDLANDWDVSLTPVQHHHAHIAAVMAEHQLSSPVLGLALDGVGLGTDGTSWGGELLKVDRSGFERISHLRELPMPGGDLCAREGWRMAKAAAKLCGEYFDYDSPKARVADLILDRGGAPVTSSMGRWFDAASAMLGACLVSRYEGEAPMILEGLAGGQKGRNLSGLVTMSGGRLDISRLVMSLKNRSDKEAASRDFHTTLALALAAWCGSARESTGISSVVLAGGCAMNQLLASQLCESLRGKGFTVYEAFKAPPNDGSIALGQVWAAAMAKI